MPWRRFLHCLTIELVIATKKPPLFRVGGFLLAQKFIGQALYMGSLDGLSRRAMKRAYAEGLVRTAIRHQSFKPRLQQLIHRHCRELLELATETIFKGLTHGIYIAMRSTHWLGDSLVDYTELFQIV